MKWLGESDEAREERLRTWHRWFAFYPVKVRAQWVWLEFVWRRVGPLTSVFTPIIFDYAIGPKPEDFFR